MVDKIIPIRIRRGDKSTRTPRDNGLPVVQEVAGVIPIAGAPLKAAIGGLLAVLQLIDRCTQNTNAPTAQTPDEEDRRKRLIKMLEDTTSTLGEMRSVMRGSPALAQEIAGCSSKIDEYIGETTLVYLMQQQTDITTIMHTQQTQFQSIMQVLKTLYSRQLPTDITSATVTMVDATGREHRMLLDQCSSFDRLVTFLPGILHQCRPDEAEIQQWYIDQGQYDIVIDDGTNVTQLTRESDVWSTIQPGTKMVMRIITAEVVRSFSARCRCRCGKWNDIKVDGATLVDALVHGCTITW
ncbi:hypothetical protein BKA82DRAFT_245764 [Pisolithus tinctorius]|uniref:Ubiquitin-like domain-containing protein n=1 Tax=Pisolithus tinctorius Marx 270 TaxID=870435 RepID=A0A0C3IHE5_PISTI|nr:hypothetical protein BKA82DRAFT_245764 [Pisolithus tinctorius]KIN96432.1 hypothetical protein M404DRAFT_245764 [Pisolithus tinctorius Marx 270]